MTLKNHRFFLFLFNLFYLVLRLEFIFKIMGLQGSMWTNYENTWTYYENTWTYYDGYMDKL